MATFKDPIKCFAPLEMIERLLEIRSDGGFKPAVYLHNSGELADYLDAYGFDIYVFSLNNKPLDYGDYRAPLVPGGDRIHGSLTAH